ncbi:MAG: DNA-formamidopyrimidine glycosylase [Candidatus Komeilibacteria bacterium CG11_big_fil_rev_8_21_14_0_20_36_20]|uniref:DNA-formamidopyrimidine glycosylase n=1 Tax=Candidatus Komeilibacteria bacterium CG11_big_fil_rev_8_21_14_0_20_36_20 TaxID=1974477 RepID=A0A2H0NEN9_9BACT|nr:MAG: DNA-formamidopyrimidine glycosylase [Candidatus Komeilibacteria bacterium CG11_big_fil_rev_8_21_14_0_20_36_20]PIR81194.1 MAG: DNA-formamidopyrimidine glycosylase [Candidatus Komeilibacteria bacterium CG10_big_fil_rev_8_21_14_0_10_36_65]PJC55746.1 MAG: DNA-formamidopyrimidine glycosylase [Candidatus Komeilibacteria bacterium CG_4_9_14_0_2_um_filter_36_13]
MPELPEVETIRIGLSNKILHKPIRQIKILKPKLVKNKPKNFQDILRNNQIINIDRRGKLLIFNLADENFLLIHLKMTGQLIYISQNQIIAGGHNFPLAGQLPNQYSHVIFSFIDNSHLFFNDLRQFGYLKIVGHLEKEKIVAKYGPEPLGKNFSLDKFKEILSKRKGVLKPLLLNQQIIAGIGNIYADEICFRAKIKPNRKINTLTNQEIINLHKATQYIMMKAIHKKGTTFSDYRDSDNQRGNFVQYLKVYGRENKKCLRCRMANIKKISLGGRGTRFCPYCQK